jgi:DNA polymerase-3 subunit delta'
MIRIKIDKFHWPILGHGQIKKYLQSSIVSNKLSHAYLFHGPESTGKLLMAYYLTASLLCQSKSDKKPCQQCSICHQTKKNICADFTVVKKEKDKKNISIRQIRELQHKLSFNSFLTKYKTIIIDDAELMTEEASNALLKTLEEPHLNTIFVLIVKDKEMLLPTVISRCQNISFNLIPLYKIENWLISLGKNKKEAKIIAHFANGRPGLANNFFNNSTLLNEQNERIDILLSIIKGGLNEKFNVIKNFLNEGKEPNISKRIDKNLDSWLNFFRDILLVKNQSSNISNISSKNKMLYLIKKYNQKQVIEIINQIVVSKKLLWRSVNPRLILENLVLII